MQGTFIYGMRLAVPKGRLFFCYKNIAPYTHLTDYCCYFLFPPFPIGNYWVFSTKRNYCGGGDFLQISIIQY